MARAGARPCYPPGFLSDSAVPHQTENSRYNPYYSQRYRDYNYGDTYLSQSDYPSFDYRSYEDRAYPDISETGYAPQRPAYDQLLPGMQYRRRRPRYGGYRLFRNGPDRRRHQQRSVRSNSFLPRLSDQIDESDVPTPARDCHLAESIPSFPIFAIKIFMSLLAGITSGIWVWSGKTYRSWKIFCKSPW